MGGGHGNNSPCASCKLLRRRCAKDCVFAPYFPPDDPLKFAIVHKVFGASNVSKMLQEIPLHQREDAVSSLVYEANARARDPVYGCVGAISYLQNQVAQLQTQLAVAQADILCIQMQMQQDQPPPPLSSFGAAAAANIPMAAQLLEPADDDLDDKSFFLQNNLPQLFNFTSSNANVNYDSYKRESIFGHDHMVS